MWFNKNITIVIWVILVIFFVSYIIVKDGLYIHDNTIANLTELIQDSGWSGDILTTPGWRLFIESVKNYGKYKSIEILWSVPFYSNNGNIEAYEYILQSGKHFIWSIYEVRYQPMSYQDTATRFFTPWFAVSLKLSQESWLSQWNRYLHSGNCMQNNGKKYCLRSLQPDKNIAGDQINAPGNWYENIESTLMKYFGNWWFWTIGKRWFTYFDPTNQRVYSPMQWDIITYTDIIKPGAPLQNK